MKRTVDINIGRVRFSIDEDAYGNLQNYLDRFARSIPDKRESEEVMEDVEIRIAELFQKELKLPNQVVTDTMVQAAIACLGDIESEKPKEARAEDFGHRSGSFQNNWSKPVYRDPDNSKIAGVCGGLSFYFEIDATFLRIMFLLALFAGLGFLLYLILWVVLPEAKSISQKLEMRNIPVTAENIKNFTV